MANLFLDIGREGSFQGKCAEGVFVGFLHPCNVPCWWLSDHIHSVSFLQDRERKESEKKRRERQKEAEGGGGRRGGERRGGETSLILKSHMYKGLFYLLQGLHMSGWVAHDYLHHSVLPWYFCMCLLE